MFKNLTNSAIRRTAFRLLGKTLAGMPAARAPALMDDVWALAAERLAGDTKALRQCFQRAGLQLLQDLPSRQRVRALAELAQVAAVDLTAEDRSRLPAALASATLDNLAGESCYRAGAALTDLVRLHPAYTDPASHTVTPEWDGLVVVGPWLMEVGFELAYWIPFIRARLAALGVSRDRVIVVSRGGAETWYSDIGGCYIDILDTLSPQEFHDWTAHTSDGNRKPFVAGPLEVDLLQRVLAGAGIAEDYRTIMPSAMYGLFRNVWRSRFGAHRFEDVLSPALLPTPLKAPALPFDGPYVAVKLYHSLTFPARPDVDAFAHDLVRRLAAETPVVLLSNPARLDDHDTLALTGNKTAFPVFDATTLYCPRDNLAVQTALVSCAQALHCTYGGFSYLGPLLGVDTFAYTAIYDFTFTHLELMLTTLDHLEGAGSLALLPVRSSTSEVPAVTTSTFHSQS